VFGVDGLEGRKRTDPFMGTPKKVDVKWNGKTIPKGALKWPLGTYALKSDLYAAVRKAVHHAEAKSAAAGDAVSWAPGSMILPGDVDLAYAEQLTSEHLKEVESKSGQMVRRWEKLTGRPNEALDIACYARAMAYHLRLDRLKPDQWAALRAERFGAIEADELQADLFAAPIAPPVTEAPGALNPSDGATRGRRIRGRAR
jgi:phage terminase large subunit GpA-like protein